PALVDAAVEPARKTRPRLDPAPKRCWQRAADLLDARMEIFCHLQHGIVGNPDLAPHARRPGRSCLQIGHADHVVVAHGVGEIFRRRYREGEAFALAIPPYCTVETV